MRSEINGKSLLTVRVLAGLMLVGALSACGGGDGGDRATQGLNEAVDRSANPLNKYIGRFSEVASLCMGNYGLPGQYRSVRLDPTFTASTIANHLNATLKVTLYSDGDCAVPAGSISVYEDFAYVDTASNVGFLNSNKQPINADRVIVNLVDVVYEGIPSDIPLQLEGSERVLIALDGNIVYESERHSALDAEGFPTLLNPSGTLLEPSL